MLVAGIMTGTSLDAIDVAVCDIQHKGDRHAISLVAFSTHPYADETIAMIRAAVSEQATMEALSDIPFALARDYAAALSELVTSHAIEAVAIHGQTLWHNPPVSTWQAASGPALSALINLPVISNFRDADVALGGQGAPLVPIFDAATLANDHDVVALNIGGMANITILPAHAEHYAIRAFDTGPGNVWIDAASRITFGMSYDSNGATARAGVVMKPFFEEMTRMPYFAAEPPKSTGREMFSEAEARRLITRFAHPSAPLEDVVTTMTELTAWSIADHIRRYAPTTASLVAAGGGVRNTYLMERLAHHCAEAGLNLTLSEYPHAQAKEAMAFAYLGWLTLEGLPGNLPSVTGAQRSAVLGTIARA